MESCRKPLVRVKTRTAVSPTLAALGVNRAAGAGEPIRMAASTKAATGFISRRVRCRPRPSRAGSRTRASAWRGSDAPRRHVPAEPGRGSSRTRPGSPATGSWKGLRSGTGCRGTAAGRRSGSPPLPVPPRRRRPTPARLLLSCSLPGFPFDLERYIPARFDAPDDGGHFRAALSAPCGVTLRFPRGKCDEEASRRLRVAQKEDVVVGHAGADRAPRPEIAHVRPRAVRRDSPSGDAPRLREKRDRLDPELRGRA